jgi:hypothetical protein
MVIERLGHSRLLVRHGFLRHSRLCDGGDDQGAPTADAGGGGATARVPLQPHRRERGESIQQLRRKNSVSVRCN